MGNLNENAVWPEGVPYFKEDAVLTGGPDCPDNVPIQALANRTLFLKKKIDDAVAGALIFEYANRLKTARTISLTGDASGSASFDGGSNIAINVTVGDDTHNHGIGTVIGLQAALDAKVGKDVQGNVGIGTAPRTWGARFPAVQINAKTAVGADANSTYYGTNWYCSTDGNADKRLGDGFALQYHQDVAVGKHIWKTAVNGAADTNIVWTAAMTLDAATGELAIPGRVRAMGGIRVPKGAPIGDGGVAGIAFDDDGDTGLFAEGGTSTGGSDLVLRVDSTDVIHAKNAGVHLPGAPTAPTPAPGTNTQQIVNAEFVQAAIAALVSSSPAALDTLNELAAALGNDPNFATTITNALAGKVGKDAQGNIGLGVIPKTWDAQYPVIQQNTKTVYAADANSSYYGTNWYHTAGTYKRLAAGFALQYQQDSSAGKHLWKTAPSDVADSIVAFTTAMSLDIATGILDVPAGITTKTPAAGDNSTKAATTEFVHGALLGNGQAWQSFAVGTQRFVGATYYNATAKPIVIAIGWYMSTSALYYLHVQGVVAGEAGGNGAALVRGQLFAIVPPGAAYLLEQSTGSLAIEYWSELR